MEQTLLFTPLAGAIIAGGAWRVIGETAARWTATALVLIAAALALLLALNAPELAETRYLHNWIESGSLSAALAFRLDRELAPMLVLVTSLSALAHIYALGRTVSEEAAKQNPGQEARLCAGMGLLTFALVLLIVADDLAQFLAGWLATGFAVYLLCGVLTRKPASGKAALRAAVTLRVSDAALLMAAGLLFTLADTIRFDDVFDTLPELQNAQLQAFSQEWPVLELIAALVGLASLVMAAQLVFFGWFSETTEAPLPGTMLILTAGPVVAVTVLLMRLGPLLDTAPIASGWLVAAAMATTVIAASSAIAQSDPLRVMSCLASAQAGFIIAALGLGATTAAQLHLLSTMPALAALSLAIGVVLALTGRKRDLDRLGGLARVLPLTFATSILAAASMSAIGLPGSAVGFSGFVSVSAVFDALADAPTREFLWAGVLAFGFVSLAIWRLVFRVFITAPRLKNPTSDPGSVGATLIVPVLILGVAGAAVVHVLGQGGAGSAGSLPVLAGLAGLGLAALGSLPGPGLSEALKTAVPWLHKALLNEWYIAPLLRTCVTGPLTFLASVLLRRQEVDREEGTYPGGLRLAPILAQQASRIQGGLVTSYGVAIGIGTVLLVVWIVLMGGGS